MLVGYIIMIGSWKKSLNKEQNDFLLKIEAGKEEKKYNRKRNLMFKSVGENFSSKKKNNKKEKCWNVETLNKRKVW